MGDRLRGMNILVTGSGRGFDRLLLAKRPTYNTSHIYNKFHS